MNMDFISVPAILGIIFYTIYRIVDLLVRRKERQIFINKLDPNNLGDQIKIPDLTNVERGLSFSSGALKFGCLFIGIGLGLLIGFFFSMCFISELNSNYEPYDVLRIQTVLYGSCVLLFGGLGLILAFLIERHYDKKD